MNTTTKNVGRVSIVPKGDWNINNTYIRLDLVTHDGNSYIAKKDVPKNIQLNNNNYWMLMASKGGQGEQGEQGAPFAIMKSYASIAAMNADFSNTDVQNGQFVIIDTGNVQDPDNAKLYYKGSNNYVFVTDMSGAAGIQGPRGTSAYEQAVAGGYTGTEAQFNEGLADFKELSEQAASSATAADNSAKDAEAYAIGKRGDTNVESTDPTYHNNAKYYSEQAALIVDDVEQVMTSTTIGPAAIATFDASAADMPLKGLTVNIEPVQAEGTPSPENPLPITGWTGVNVFDDPKYAFPINWNQIRTDSAQTRTLDGITTAYNPQTHLITITNNSRTTSYSSGSTQCIVSNVDPIPGHRYALLGEYHSGVCVSAVNDNNTLRATTNVGHIMTMPSSTATMFKLRITSNYDFAAVHPVGDVYSFYLNIVDITQLLGEEAAETATYDQIAEMFPNDWYPYNAGEITCVSAVNGDTYQKIAVNWQNEAGAVYGGTLDTVNKKLTVTKRYALLNDTTKWTEITGTGVHTYRYMTSFPDRKKYETSYLGFICSFATADSSASFYARWSGVDTALFGFKATNGTPTLEEIKTAAANNEIAICYDLAEPLVYELADIPGFTTLIGTNNIWANCGDVTVTYGAYLETVKSYADQVGDSILSTIAPLEASYIASRPYSVGEFLFVGAKFYKVTSAIAEGATITPDTNVKQFDVSDCINDPELHITEQPKDFAYSGEYKVGVIFSCHAEGGKSPYSYRWQVFANNSWLNTAVPGANGPNVIFVPSNSWNGRSYRCIVTDSDGKQITSSAAILTIS